MNENRKIREWTDIKKEYCAKKSHHDFLYCKTCFEYRKGIALSTELFGRYMIGIRLVYKFFQKKIKNEITLISTAQEGSRAESLNDKIFV